ncbi:hypothetical protein C8R47DRAFT_981032 [Mycena vitilis]|nr:hypothetical protein C8R47DRAFT_981032 [Mycena vitilis]
MTLSAVANNSKSSDPPDGPGSNRTSLAPNDLKREASVSDDTDSENETREILPAMGAFVVFTIDPVASLDPETLEDPEAISACKRLVNKKYVAIAQRKEFYRPWDPYNECIVDFVLQGEPRTCPDRCMEASMSIPIVPTTRVHPLSRLPLTPSNPLPWNDCYVSCFFAAKVRSPTLFTQDPIGWKLVEEELAKQSRFLLEDMARKNDLAWEKTAAEQLSAVISDVPQETHDSPNQDTSTPKFALIPHVADSRATLRPSSVHSELRSESAPHTPEHIDLEDMTEDESNLDDVFDSIISDPQAPQGMITVTFSHDLSAVQELNNPDDYFQEVALIDQ